MVQVQYIGDDHTYIALSKTGRYPKVKVVNGEIIELPDDLYPLARLTLAGFKVLDKDTLKEYKKTEKEDTDEVVTEEVVEKPKKGKKNK